jgi:hypothetical protein
MGPRNLGRQFWRGNVRLIACSAGASRAGAAPGNCTNIFSLPEYDVLSRRSITAAASLVIVPCSIYGSAHAQFQPGELFTYSQVSWTGPLVPGSGAELIQTRFDFCYPNGYLEVGVPGAGGYSMIFTGPLSVRAYLPASGSYGPLTSDVLDPQSSSAGTFGGLVVALQLNVDFGDAGYLLGATGISFGDLRLVGMSAVDNWSVYDRLTVHQLLDIANDRLGHSLALYDYEEIGSLTDAVTRAFENGQPSQFAQDHLRIEPPGDFDRDGDADGADFLKWQRAVGSADSIVDDNRDGLVDGWDLAIWASGFVATASGSSVSVPEPPVWAVAAIGLAPICRQRRKVGRVKAMRL